MTTPAQEAGFIQNVTKLKLTGNGPMDDRYGNFSALSEKVWVLDQDDGSRCPYFRALDGTRDSLCAYVTDFKAVSLTPAQEMGLVVGVTRVRIASEADRVGEQAGVFIFKQDDHSHSPFFMREGEPDSLECFTLTRLEVLPPATAPSPLAVALETAGVVSYTATQKLALDTFQAMYDAAVAYREGRHTTLNYNYGICDNIDRYASAAGTSEHVMAQVKENLIRATPSYSGVYHYPVPCPEGGDASNAFSRSSDKWSGAYGLNRLQQLSELIELIKTKWDDSLTLRKTPAQRNNLEIGDVVSWTQRRGEGVTLWVFLYDDQSMSPRFHKLGDETQSRDIDLNEVKKVSAEDCKERSVSEFLEALQDAETKKKELEAQLAALTAAIAEAATEIAMLDLGLAKQHKVKRI